MQIAANSNLVLTNLSSFSRLPEWKSCINHGEFYQQFAEELTKDCYLTKSLDVLARSLVGLAHRAYTFRKMDLVEQASQVLMNLPHPVSFEVSGSTIIPSS